MGGVLVVGGGVAGTATAMALHKAGLGATVFEAYSRGGDDAGAFLTLGANGMLALDALDAAGLVAEAGFELHTLEVTDCEGTLLGSRPLMPAGPDVPGYQCLYRSELYRVLQAELLDGGVRAVFSDGTSAAGELLVGADGLRSTVRTVIDPAAPEPRYVGVRVFYGYASDAEPRGKAGVLHIVRGSTTAFGYTIDPEGRTWWFARLHGPELDRTTIARTRPPQWRSDLEAAFGRDRSPAADIVAATGEELFVTNARDIATLPTWHRGGMVVLGDAAHPASPASGQGASMALEDAVVLGKALRDIPDRARALDAFEQLRRHRTEANVAASAALDADDRALQ
ncbi:MAG: FAD-dependent monooxygenase [Pseudonocardiaceae bacterium]